MAEPAGILERWGRRRIFLIAGITLVVAIIAAAIVITGDSAEPYKDVPLIEIDTTSVPIPR
jgi:hypothetical protein